MFEVELAKFARQVEASRNKKMVLDSAGWHTSVRLQATEHIHLLYLPDYSPGVQAAEHLWLLSDSSLAI